MGKKSQTKDRGYITAAEWQSEWGGHKDKSKRPFNSLPFNCCAITFTPFQDPVSTPSHILKLVFSTIRRPCS
jgi:peptidyl-prolyl cis-trans isomerase-like protein 2